MEYFSKSKSECPFDLFDPISSFSQCNLNGVHQFDEMIGFIQRNNWNVVAELSNKVL